jgi:dihydrodipicolinate synthase/N-acetylneuraminate lyase
MMLPMASHWTPEGVARGVRDFVAAAGKPAIVYVRSAGYLEARTLGELVAAGEVVAVKYAVPRAHPSDDPYLAALCAEIGAERIASGSGEVLALAHLRAFGLAGFTAGCVCIAPRLSMRVLEALKAEEWDEAERLVEAIRPLETLRERRSVIAVLHEAVRLAGIAETGPLYPMLSNVPGELEGPIRDAVRVLQAAELEPGRAAA